MIDLTPYIKVKVDPLDLDNDPRYKRLMKYWRFGLITSLTMFFTGIALIVFGV